MLRKILVLSCAALACASCLKDASTDDTYYFVDATDTEGIELFLTTHKVIEGEYGPDLEITQPDDPHNLWNTRRRTALTKNTPYTDLIGQAFQDTTNVKMVTAAGDTIPIPAGVWVYVNKRGYSTDRPTDSSAVLVTYTGTLLNEKQFTIAPIGTTIYLYSDNIVGFRLGLKYFEKGHLVTELVTPEPNEDGTQDPPYEQDVWKDGGQGWIIIPSKVGYGNLLASDVPPNSVLIFRIDLLSVAYYPTVEDQATLSLGRETTAWVNTPPSGKTVKQTRK